MQKLTTRRKRWLIMRAIDQARRCHRTRPINPLVGANRGHVETVDIWQGGEVEKAICHSKPVFPPSPLCFDKNPAETLRYLDALRRHSFARRGKKGFVYRPKRARAMPRIRSYASFEQLEEISTAAAVVMAADYERLSIKAKEIPPTINLDRWHPAVFRKLFQIGFFEIVGLSAAAESITLQDGDTMTMPIISGQNADDLIRVDEGLKKLAEFLGLAGGFPDEVGIPFLTAISEALANVTNHAYAPQFQTELPHVGRFWISASADRSNHSLTIVVYDQGSTIPYTYPRIGRLPQVARFLRTALRRQERHPYENDGVYVRAALRYGGSRTDHAHRGKGFPQMLQALDKVGAGTVKIRSRGGWSVRYPTKRVVSGSEEHSIGGTLVEWNIELHQRAVGK